MVSRLAILSIISLNIWLCQGQDLQKSLPWTKDFRLQWSNFKGQIPPDRVAVATTASGISYEYSASMLFNEVTVDYTVTAFFYPKESWYKPNLCDDATLAHEQLHFDITEMFARRMRKKMANTTFSSNVKQEVKAIYNQILKELDNMQQRYDWETDYSRNRQGQQRWNTYITQALELLEQ